MTELSLLAFGNYQLNKEYSFEYKQNLFKICQLNFQVKFVTDVFALHKHPIFNYFSKVETI